MNDKLLSVYDLVIVSVFISIIFVQEQLTSFLPNIQLTIFLIIFISKKLKFINAVLIVIGHVLLDSLLNGSFNLLYAPAMLIGYLFIPITLNTLFKKVNTATGLANLSVLYALIYSWSFIIPFVYIMKVDIIAYLVSDILFELILLSSSFITTILLYNPLAKAFDDLSMKYPRLEK